MLKGFSSDEEGENKEELIIKKCKLTSDNQLSGCGSDECGGFSISGEIMPEHHTFMFTKTYDDDEGHIVEYRGFMNTEKTKFTGTWNLPDETLGRFTLKAVNDPELPRFKLQQDGRVFWRQKEDNWV